MQDIRIESSLEDFVTAEAPNLPKGDVAKWLFADAKYPMQLDTANASGFAGEMRGFYGMAGTWHPALSRFGAKRTTGVHRGVDIYAPRGTRIVAPFAGKLERPTNPDDLGLRVHIAFTFNKVGYRFVLGHLDEFVGAAGAVTAGDVIGLAGCSGNADKDEPCSKKNACERYSTHVHIQLMRDDLVVCDPLKALGWKLRYADEEGSKNCKDLGLY